MCVCVSGGGFFFPEGKGKVPCDGSLWVPRMIYKKKNLKKNSTPLTMLPSFSPSLRTRAGGEEIIDWKGTACKVEIKAGEGVKGTEKTGEGRKSFPEAEPRLCEEGLAWVAASIQGPPTWQNDWQIDRGRATSSHSELWPSISHTSYYSLSVAHREEQAPICMGSITKKPHWPDKNRENASCGWNIP